MSDETTEKLREAARSIQGNLGRCLYRRKDVDEMRKVSDLLFEAADTIASIGNGTLTAEQVREAIEANSWAETSTIREFNDSSWQAIADELNATLGSDTKPCYAADENYKRCKYSVNRGWRDDAPFLVWDDTGHLFITMGGLKTWDVTGDAKKWFAELGSGTCELHDCDGSFSAVNRPVWRCDCGAFMTQYTDATTYHKPRFCPNCGRQVTR